MKKSASLVAETVDLLGEVLGEAKLVYKDETFFVPDWVAADMFKSQKDWAKQATAKSKERAQRAGGGKVPKTYTPGTKKAVLPPSLIDSFKGMDIEIQRDLAVIYYENQEILDSFLKNRAKFDPSVPQGSWVDNNGLTQDIVDQIYVLETKGRSDVVGKGEALALMYWSGGIAAAGTTTSTATIDLVLSGQDVSVKAVSTAENKFSFKVNGTLESFKKIAQQKLASSNSKASRDFEKLWSTSLTQETIFSIAQQKGTTQEEFTALVDSLDASVREMKGSSGSTDYIYMIVSPAGWKVIPKADPSLTFGGITEGKVTVIHGHVTKLRHAATVADFSTFVRNQASTEAPGTTDAEKTVYDKYLKIINFQSIDENNFEDALKFFKSLQRDINGYKNKLQKTQDEIDAAASANKKTTRSFTTERQKIWNVLRSDNSKFVAAVNEATGILDQIQKIMKKKNRSQADDSLLQDHKSQYARSLEIVFGTSSGTPLPWRLGAEDPSIESFQDLMQFEVRSGVTESRRRKPRRSEASMGGALGAQVPMGRGPDGKPDRRTSNAILRKNGRTQARYFGGGSIVEETRDLLGELLDGDPPSSD